MYGPLLFLLFRLLARLLGGGRGTSLGLRHLARWALILLYTILGTVIVLTVSASADLSENAVLLLWTGTVGGVVAGMHLAPGWLAWRVLGPQRWRRPGRALLALSLVGRRRSEWQGEALLFRVAFEPEPPDLRNEPASPWAAIALVVAAERRGDVERGRRLAAAIDEIPMQALLSRRLRVAGIEQLALSAARRGDWREVEQRVRHGSGRGVRLLRLLARLESGTAVSPLRLRLAWLLAPWRRESGAWLGHSLAAATPVEEVAVPDTGTGPWRRHLDLLSAAAAGHALPAGEIRNLLGAWEHALDRRGEAEWIARGLELEARAPAEAWGEIRARVLRELDLLLDTVAGPWPHDGSGLAAELIQRRRGRLLESLQRWTAPFADGGANRTYRAPLEEWEDWIAFRSHVLEITRAGGQEALQTAWHNGVRLAACNWPVHLHRIHGESASWAAYIMHLWSYWLASWVGDAAIEKLSGSNFQILSRKVLE
jgi:hypothetical protein